MFRVPRVQVSRSWWPKRIVHAVFGKYLPKTPLAAPFPTAATQTNHGETRSTETTVP